MSFNQFILINLGAIISALGGIFLKKFSVILNGQSFFDGGFIFKILFNPYFWLGGFCYVIPIFFWAYLLRTLELTKMQPVLSVVYIYTVLFAYLILNERPSYQCILGILVIILGVYLVGRS